MNQLEQNVANSFRLAKNDIITLQQNIAVLTQNQERIMEWLSDLRDKESQLYHRMKAAPKKAVALKTTKHSKKFVASRTGSKVHEANCPFAKNIKPKSRVIFSKKDTAFNQGYKACECIKRI